MGITLQKPAAIIINIEGTISDINFIKGTLMPFIRNHLDSFLTQTWNEKLTKQFVDQLRKFVVKEQIAGSKMPSIASSGSSQVQVIKSIVTNIKWQMDHDIKNPLIKGINILLCEWGCRKKSLEGHVFDDVPVVLHNWKNQNIKLYVFSSGFLLTHKLLLTCSLYGNLQSLFDDFFGERMGNKNDPQTFKKIANKIKVESKSILFITSKPEDAKAAESVGCQTVVVERPAFNDEDRKAFHVVSKLNFISFTNNSH